jgi:hypothetical protein
VNSSLRPVLWNLLLTHLETRVQDVIDLPVQMARDQIEQSLRAKMASIKECMMQLQGSQKGLQSTES